MKMSEFRTTSLCFSSHRHLKSETYRTLVHILSHCYDYSQISVPQEPSAEMCGHGELVGPDAQVPCNSGAEADEAFDKSTESGGLEVKGFGDIIEDIMQVEGNGDLVKNNWAVCNGDEWIGDYEGLDQQKMLMDELEHIIHGEKILIQENTNGFPTTSAGNDQNGADALMDDGQEHVDVHQILNEEPRSMVELQVGQGESNLDAPKSFDSSVNGNMNSQDSRLVEDSEERNSILRTDALEVENEMQQKEMEVENLLHANGIIDAHDYRAEDAEIEEGEISGCFVHDEESVDMICDNSVVSNEKKEDEKQVSEDVTDMRGLSWNEKSRGIEIFSESTFFSYNAVDHSPNGREEELKETVRNDTQCKSKSLAGKTAMMAVDEDKNNNMPGAGMHKGNGNRDKEGTGSFSVRLDGSKVYKEIVEEKVTQKQGNVSKDKPDSGVCIKKKRSAPSKEKKAKKKQKERIKRAEKNRKLGVRRLKLPLNLKPKTVKYCHHYLKGRCHEGDKCKFSHDTVPLTKSTKPCCHFARNSCMKGDNCPFDHELSKYPCENFVTKRFCNRGDDCLFSHKMPPKAEGTSASSTCTPELKPLPPTQAPNDSDLVCHQNVGALSNHGKVSSFKNKEQNVAKNVLKPPAVAPKGITCLFLGKSSVFESRELNQGSSSPKTCDSGKFTNQAERIASVTVQNGGETPRRISAASKGVNFLSFGNVPFENSNGKKLASLFLNRENDSKSSLSNKFSLHEKACLFPRGEKSVEVGNATTQRFLSSVEKSNDMPKQTQPSITPRGLNFLSTREGLANNSISNKQSSLQSNVGVINISLQESQNTPDVPQTSMGNPWRLPGSSLALGHSLGQSEQGYYRSTPNSAQKALAFATKIEPKVKINPFAVGSGFNSATTSSISGGRRVVSYNDLGNG